MGTATAAYTWVEESVVGCTFSIFSIAATALLAAAQPDPNVAKVPLDRWLTETEPSHFRWTARIDSVSLASRQRLRARVEVQVDGEDIAARRGHGQLLILMQFTDSQGRAYQTGKGLDLQEVNEAASKMNYMITQDAFVIPGDYRVAFAIIDTMTREHNVLQRTLHVNPLKNDPLPEAWRDLLPVELLQDPPDDIFIPSITGRLRLPLATKRPVRVEVLVNVSRSLASPVSRSARASRPVLNELIPALNVISNVDVRNGKLNVTLLDLARRSVAFEQEAVHDLDWAKLQTALSEANPLVIDLHSLESRGQSAQFFVKQVDQRIAPGKAPDEPLPVVIVLSGPMAFDSGEDLRPIETGAKLDGKIFYFRYHAPPPIQTLSSLFEDPRSRRRTFPNPPAGTFVEPPDSLASTLKPLHPRLFDVYSPEQFRRALGSLLDEISRM